MMADISHRTPAELSQLDDCDLMALRNIAVHRVEELNAMLDGLHENAPTSQQDDIMAGLCVWRDALHRYEEAERLRDEEWSRLMAGDFSSHPGLV